MIAKMVKVAHADELAPRQGKVVEADGPSIAFSMCAAHSVQLTTLAGMWEDR